MSCSGASELEWHHGVSWALLNDSSVDSTLLKEVISRSFRKWKVWMVERRRDRALGTETVSGKIAILQGKAGWWCLITQVTSLELISEPHIGDR